MFFESWHSLGRTALAGVLGYVALVTFLRLSGKRTLTKLNAFDLVVTVALGSTLASLLTSRNLAIADGVLALGVLIGLQYLVATGVRRWPRLERLVKSQPSLVLHQGEPLPEVLARERLTIEEVLSAVRGAGVLDPERIEAVVFETDGSFSVIPRGEGDAAEERGLDASG